MENIEALSIKTKLIKSRTVFNDRLNRRFLAKLYDILENPVYKTIITWSSNRRIIMIRDESRLVLEVLPLFEDCRSLTSFYQKLEGCQLRRLHCKTLSDQRIHRDLTMIRNRKPLADKGLEDKTLELEPKTAREQVKGSDSFRYPSKVQKQEDSAVRSLMHFSKQLQTQIEVNLGRIRLEFMLLESDIDIASRLKKRIENYGLDLNSRPKEINFEELFL